jgi:hypothetical protein
MRSTLTALALLLASPACARLRGHAGGTLRHSGPMPGGHRHH